MSDFGATYDEMETTATKLDDGKESIEAAGSSAPGAAPKESSGGAADRP